MQDIVVLAAKLKKEREAIGLSQGALAKALGLSSEYISLLEAGKRTPSFVTLNKIAAYLNKDISYFFKEKEGAFNILFRAEGLDERAKESLKKFRRYCDEYLHLETVTGRKLELGPLYTNTSPDRMADEERRRLNLGSEPIRNIFTLCETNGCRILRLPMPEDSKVSGVFIYLEEKEAAFALVNNAQSIGRQAFNTAHEYCHYLKDRWEGPVIDNPDVFIDEYVSLYHPREQFAQTFAARFLMPPAKVQEIIEKDCHSPGVNFDQVLYLKRYFGVSTLAMLRTLRDLGYVSKAQFEEFRKAEPARREKELFGNLIDEDEEKGSGAVSGLSRSLKKGKRRAILSDRFKLLRDEAAKMKKRKILKR